MRAHRWNSRRVVTGGGPPGPEVEARRALVLHDGRSSWISIGLTLNHGLFVVRAAGDLAEAATILAEWHPDMTVIDMDHEDSSEPPPAARSVEHPRRQRDPVLGLTRRGDLKTKLKAFDLGVDDILTDALLARGAPRSVRSPSPAGRLGRIGRSSRR